MKNIKTIFLIFYFISSLLFLSCDSTNQTNTENNAAPTDTSSNIKNENTEVLENSLRFNENGYELPDLNKYEVSEKHKKVDIKSPKPVYQNIYLPKSEDILKTDSFKKSTVLSVREYEIESRVFCYIIPIKPRANISMMTNLIYYDLDGDGKFEIQDMKFTDFPIMFPKWLNKD